MNNHGRSNLLRFLMMGVLLLICIGLEYSFHRVRGIHVVYTHLFYIPIVVAALWWGLKGGLSVSLFLALMYTIMHTISCIPGIIVSVLARTLAFVFIGFVVGIVSDRRKRTEKTQLVSERKFKDLVESTSDWVWEVNRDGVYTYASPKVKDILGYKVDEVIGKTPFYFMTKEEAERVGKIFKEKANNKKSFYQLENTNRHKDGRLIMLETSGVPILNNRAILVGYRGIDRDITERKKAEEEKERLLHNVGERIKELNCLYSLSKLVEKPDISVEGIFQGIVELLPTAWQYPDITCAKIAFEDKEFKTEGFKTSKWKQSADIKVHGERVGIIEVCYLEEKPKTYEGPFLKQERKLIDAIAERLGRITQRKRTEEALQKSEQWFSTTLKSIGDAVIATDTKGHVIFLNSIAEFLTGWKQEEAVGKPLNKILNIINEKTGKPAENPIKRVLREGIIVGLANHTVLIAKNGKRYPIADSGAPIKDNRGKIIGTVMVFRDITERKKADERKAEFLSNVSHALRTPLTSIKSFTEILLKYKDVNSVEQRKFLATISNETDRLTHLINKLLDLDKIEHGELKWKSASCDILNIMRNSINEVDPLIKEKNIVVNINLPSQNLIANGNEDKLKEVLVNLIGNAIKFTPSKGEIRITVEKRKETIEVSIADTGIGIPKDELTNIFERFNRLDNSINRKVTGTGLGLYICKQIIEKHEGKIWAESSGSNGSKFIFVLSEYKPALTKERNEPKRSS